MRISGVANRITLTVISTGSGTNTASEHRFRSCV